MPFHIRNAPTHLMEKMGYGKGYLYPHDYPDALVPQEYMPHTLKGRRYYFPKERGEEKRLKEFMDKVKAAVERDRPQDDSPER